MIRFVLVLNTKKAELSKLKNQLEQSKTENGHKSSLANSEYASNKRVRHQISDADTSDDEMETSTQDNSLDLGDDQVDYKTSTISKHHQRRKQTTDENPKSTRPIIHRATTTTTPSLPDDSQTTDDLLNKI